MPVGHAVTATIRRRAAGRRRGGRGRLRRDRRRGAGGRGRRGRGRRDRRGGGLGRRRRDHAATSSTTSAGLVALRRPSVKLFFTSARASWVSTLRCVASPPAGAAIRNARSAGPSLAPKSVAGAAGRTRGWVRRPPRCGSAGSRCRRGARSAEVASRASASSASWSASPVRPASATYAGQRTDDLRLVGAQSRRRAGRAPGDHGRLLRRSWVHSLCSRCGERWEAGGRGTVRSGSRRAPSEWPGSGSWCRGGRRRRCRRRRRAAAAPRARGRAGRPAGSRRGWSRRRRRC